ncbi:MAG: HAD-IIIA family hydrolase [Desulfobacterales bacterium]|nr:HAD-IIIA family hydrolase [Desulfobacterales bacterium]
MKAQLSQIKLLLLDVDGVLTNGQITYTDSGAQVKSFNSKDGLGIRLLMDAGIQVGIVTGRTSGALRHRCENLGLDLLFDGIKDKSKSIETISQKMGIAPEKMAFMGDDLIDLPAMTRVGFSVAVADAVPEVRQQADFITRAKGGQGAVREFCELILKSNGLWDKILESYLK